MKTQRVKFRDIEQVPHLNIVTSFKSDFCGSSPAPFIGRYGYPHVNIGVLSPQFSGDVVQYDSPKLWSNKQYTMGTIASLRYGLVNSHSNAYVKDRTNTFLDICREVGMAKRSAEVEISLQSKPQLQLHPEREIKPFGPQGIIRKARITENTKVDTRVDKIVSDTDLKAASAVLTLYKKGFEENSIHKLLSVGTLGIGKQRKLVPTRWSITAVDDTIANELIKEIKEYPVGEYSVYFGGDWGNYYIILFFSDVWQYELFETYLDLRVNPWSKNGYAYSTDYEPYLGRKTYAEETAGGFYAARVPILEKIKERKRQGSCLALRFISPEYNVPLGVWVCREASRKCLQEKPVYFASKELMIMYTKELIQRKFGFNVDLLLHESILLKELNVQKKLVEF